LGLVVVTGVEVAHGDIRSFYLISHPHLILLDEVVHISDTQPSNTLTESSLAFLHLLCFI
jgi:hypothetical protein